MRAAVAIRRGVLIAAVAASSVAFVVDQPGTWRVHVQDPVAACTFDLTVQARPHG